MRRSLNLLPRIAVASLSIMVIAACGGGSSDTGSKANATKAASSASAVNNGFKYVPIQNDLVVGRNRFVLAILDGRTDLPLPDAQVRFRFFQLQGDQGTLKFESDATFRAPAREAGLAPSVPHLHADGTIHNHQNIEGDIGVYTSEVAFDKAGSWGIEALVTAKDGRKETLRAPFEVQATSKVPQVGQPAPKSHQLLVKDVKDITEIDSSAEPDPQLHNMTVADAVASGKPTLVTFATPGYCSSRVCGPSIEIVKHLMPNYDGKVNFIHVEVYKQFSPLVPSDTFNEWNLKTEPWFFVIDSKGIITARFEGPTTGDELKAALNQAGQ